MASTAIIHSDQSINARASRSLLHNSKIDFPLTLDYFPKSLGKSWVFFTYESEIVTTISPAKMFKACILDGGTLIPKIVPQSYKSVEYIEGNGEPGSIRKVTFGEGSQFNYMKQKVESLDKENFTYSYSVIEGDALMNSLEKITYDIKLEPSANGGSICKTTSMYYTVGDFKLTEEGIKAGKEKALGMFKAIEAYLLANPDAY